MLKKPESKTSIHTVALTILSVFVSLCASGSVWGVDTIVDSEPITFDAGWAFRSKLGAPFLIKETGPVSVEDWLEKKLIGVHTLQNLEPQSTLKIKVREGGLGRFHLVASIEVVRKRASLTPQGYVFGGLLKENPPRWVLAYPVAYVQQVSLGGSMKIEKSFWRPTEGFDDTVLHLRENWSFDANPEGISKFKEIYGTLIKHYRSLEGVKIARGRREANPEVIMPKVEPSLDKEREGNDTDLLLRYRDGFLTNPEYRYSDRPLNYTLVTSQDYFAELPIYHPVRSDYSSALPALGDLAEKYTIGLYQTIDNFSDNTTVWLELSRASVNPNHISWISTTASGTSWDGALFDAWDKLTVNLVDGFFK